LKRRCVVFAVIFAVSILIGLQAVEVVDANPYFNTTLITPPSDAIAPIISINSPQNNNNYSGDFNITFTVRGIQYSDYFSEIARVTYIIDNESFSIPLNGKDVLAIGEYNTSFIAPTLATGNHSLTVRATGIAFKLNSVYFTMDSSSQVYFTTSDNSITSITPNPSVTTGTGSDYLLNQTNLILVTIVIAIVAVASMSLVYFMRRKNNLTNKQSFL
jgi:hypothetical protein